MSSKKGTSSSSKSGNKGGGNDKSEHEKRQKLLQDNINKLKRKGATEESIAGLTAKKEKEDKLFKGLQSGKDYVKGQLGLIEKKAGPFDYLQKGKTTGIYASKLKGKDADFFGQEASQATNEYLVSIGEAKVGNYFKKVGGENIRISKEEGERLKKAGDPNVHSSYILTSAGHKLKYGQGAKHGGGAMGTGNRKGILTSTPISFPMYKQQQKLLGILTGGLGVVTGGFAGMAMRGASIHAFSKMDRYGYAGYLDKFYNRQGGDTSSLGIKTSGERGSGGGGGGEVSSSGMINTSATADNTQITKFKKKKAGQGSDTVASSRSLLATSNKTITGYMA